MSETKTEPPARMANRDLINYFVENGPFYGVIDGYGSVRTHHGKLYSYSARIAEWTDDETLIVHAGWDGYSPTTSKHMKFLYDAVVGKPDSYAYETGSYDSERGYENDEPVVPVAVSDRGSGRFKRRWRRLTRHENAEKHNGGDA